MIKACIFLSFVVLTLWPLLARCTTTDAHGDRKWRKEMEPFFNTLRQEAIREKMVHGITDVDNFRMETPAASAATNVQTDYSKVMQAEMVKVFNDVRKDLEPWLASQQKFNPASGKFSTSRPFKFDYTKDIHSTTEEYATKEYPTTAQTVPNEKSEYFKELKTTMDSFFDVYFRVIGRGPEKKTMVKENVSSESQETKEHAKDTHPTVGYTKTAAESQSTQSYQTGYSATVHPVTVDYSVKVGSVKGVPGVDFPNYTDIPLTSFTCFDMDYLPGFYADLETRCQVFHACWPNRRESFLCPLGTMFNQALMACDYWYSTNCSLAPHYYNMNAETFQLNKTEGKPLGSISTFRKDAGSQFTTEDSSKAVPVSPETVVSLISQFLPVKAKVVIYPETAGKRAKIVASASVGHDTVKKVREEKQPRQFRVVKEQRPASTESPEVPYTTTKQSVSTKAPNYITEEAADLIINRLVETIKYVFKAHDDIMDKVSIRSRHWPDLDESKYAVHPEMRLLDETTQKLLEKLSDGIIDFFKGGARRREMKAESKKSTADKTYTLTQLNPRFIVKPVDISQELKHTKSVPRPTQSSFKVTSTTKHTATLKPETSTEYSGPGISPLTKKALARNYLRLLRARSG